MMAVPARATPACALMLPVLLLLLLVISTVVISPVSSAAADARLPSNIAKYGSNTAFLAPTLDQWKKIARPGRSYSLIVLLTASKNSGVDCGPPCALSIEHFKVAKHSHDLFLKSAPGKEYHKNNDNHLHFVVLDLLQSKEVLLHLQAQHVPQYFYYPVTIGQYSDPNPERRQFKTVSENVGQLLDFINAPRKSEHHIKLVVPVDYSRVLFNVIFALAALGLAAVFYSVLLQGGLIVRALIAIFSFVFVLVFNGGYMWVQIRNPPFASSNTPKKLGDFLMGGAQQQNGSEVFLSAIGSGVGGLAFAIMVLVMSGQKRNSSKGAAPRGSSVADSDWWRSWVCIICLGLFVLSVSFLALMFGLKSEYPFRMLL